MQHKANNGRLRWYHLASAFFLLQTYGALGFVDRLVYGEWEGKSGTKISQSLNLLVIAVSILLFLRAFRLRKSVGTGGTLALVLAVFLILSASWSIDPQVSARRGIEYLLFVLGVIGVAGNLEADEFMHLLRVTCFLSVVVSIVLLAVSPGTALMADGVPVLRGVFSHKNVLGQVMAIGALGSLHGMRAGVGQRLSSTFMLLVFILATLASRSSTALLVIIAFCITSGIIALFLQGGASRALGISAIVVLLPIAVAVAIYPDSVMEMLGKDPTLTGRTDLWGYVIKYISERPIFGWGLSAFWSPANPLAGQISSDVGWLVPEAHNGLLELLLEVGIVGTIIYFYLWIRNIVLALRCFRTPAKELGISTFLCCGGLAIVGVSEEILLDPSQASVGVFFVTGFMCERIVRAKRRRRFPIAQLAGGRREHNTPVKDAEVSISRISLRG